MSEYGHSAMCDCAVCDDIAFRKSVRRTVAPSECDINPKVVSISLRSNKKPHFGQSDAVMNNLAGYTKEEHEEAASMSLDEALMRRYIQPQILPHATILQLEVDLLRRSIDELHSKSAETVKGVVDEMNRQHQLKTELHIRFDKVRKLLEEIIEMRPAVCRDCADDFTEVRNIARKALEI